MSTNFSFFKTLLPEGQTNLNSLTKNLHALGFDLANNPKDFTRLSQSSESTIDLVFSNFTVQTHVHNSSASDHFGVIVESGSINTKEDSESSSFISRN